MTKHDYLKMKAQEISKARKSKMMAKGGIVDLDEEHETGLFERMKEADQAPVASPKVEELHMHLAKMLHEESEAREVEHLEEPEEIHMAEGGMIEPEMDDKAPIAVGLSEAAKKALDAKKKMRKFS